MDEAERNGNSAHMTHPAITSLPPVNLATTSALFRGTAEHYARARPAYHPDFFALFDEAVAGLSGRAILDLGCGTGQLAFPLAHAGARVTAIDPDADMLRVGKEVAAREAVATIRWLQGSDATLRDLPNHSFRACVIGTAFHWMDRIEVLRELDRVVDYFGFLAILRNGGGTGVWSDQPTGWPAIVRAVLTELLGEARRAGEQQFHGYGSPDEDLVRKSAFSSVTEFRFVRTMDFTIEQIIDLQLSSSYSTPLILGSRLAVFRNELHRRLGEANRTGIFPTEIITSGLLCTRPSPNMSVWAVQ